MVPNDPAMATNTQGGEFSGHQRTVPNVRSAGMTQRLAVAPTRTGWNNLACSVQCCFFTHLQGINASQFRTNAAPAANTVVPTRANAFPNIRLLEHDTGTKIKCGCKEAESSKFSLGKTFRTITNCLMKTDFRIEADSMGEMKVPADAYYGAQTARAVENFPISNLRFSRQFIRALGLIKKHAAATNAGLGYVPPKIAKAIQQAAQEVIDGKWDSPICRGYFSDRLRHLHEHERQRGDRQSRH